MILYTVLFTCLIDRDQCKYLAGNVIIKIENIRTDIARSFVMINWLKQLFKKIRSDKTNTEENKDLHLQKLTPTKTDKMDYYKEALDFVFQENNLLNIAITGAYSAGKSSVINTYEGMRKEKKFLYISLACFEQTESQTDCVKETNKSEIEGKILNQLIHQIDSNRIPQTCFKVKNKTSNQTIIKHTIFIGLFVILTTYLYKFQGWKLVVEGINESYFKKLLDFTMKNDSYIFALIISIVIFFSYLYKFIKIQFQRPIFKKIKWQSSEIEIFEKNDESYFNKYLDEILYLFQNANIDAVIFEDIDRFNNNAIFSNLREINYLVNKKIEKPLRFFYLLRDDIFTSKDRTKFFDFMMPIVPVIDGSNSISRLIEYFECAGLIENFENSFLERLSLYIDDMRLLKNIYNEFIIYTGRIGETDQNYNKLLAIIVYKNIFPKDFSDLQINSGFVYNIFANKEKAIVIDKLKLDSKIKEFLTAIEKINSEHLCNLDELDTLFIKTIGLNVNGKPDNQFTKRIDFIKEIKNNPDSVYTLNGYKFDVRKALNDLDDHSDYIERKRIIEQKTNNSINNIEEEISTLKSQREKLNLSKIRELSKDSIEQLFKVNEESKYDDIIRNPYFPLIKYLIRNGYIDETYCDYLTYFYDEKKLFKEDKIFLRSVTDENAKDFDFKLKNVDTIVNKLKKNDFEKEEILNYDVLSFLMIHQHKFLPCFFEQIINNKRFDFIWGYILNNQYLDKFIYELNKRWTKFCLNLLINNDITEAQKDFFITNSFYYSSIKQIEAMNINNCITNYLALKENLLCGDDPNIPLIIKGLITLKVKFKYIQYEKINKDLFHSIYQNNLYELDFRMIQIILEKVYNLESSSDFISRNYTLINSLPNEPLANYVDKNIDEYLTNLIVHADILNDSEDNVLRILNHRKIATENKIAYIAKAIVNIDDLNRVNCEENLWEELFNSNRVKYSVNNALLFYFNCTHSLDKNLIEYLNSSPSSMKFNYHEIKDDFSDEDIDAFYAEVLDCEELSDVKYEAILKEYPHSIELASYTKISEDKVKILLKLNMLKVTKENIKSIRSRYPNLSLSFFCSDILSYIDCLADDEIIDYNEIVALLDEPSISEEQKITLVDKSPYALDLVNKSYSERLQLHIMDTAFDPDELIYFIKRYDNSSTVMKKRIVELCVANTKNLVDTALSYDLLCNVISNTGISDDLKKSIIYFNLDSFSLSNLDYCLTISGLTEFRYILRGKRPKVLVNQINKDLLTYFDKQDWIYGFDEDSKNPAYFRVRGRNIIK